MRVHPTELQHKEDAGTSNQTAAQRRRGYIQPNCSTKKTGVHPTELQHKGLKLPYQWELLADRLRISNHRSRWTLILLNRRGLLAIYKLLVSLNSCSVDLLSQFKPFVLKLCTDYSMFMYSIYPLYTSIPPVMNLSFLSWRMLIYQ